jgi:hypothetical protein
MTVLQDVKRAVTRFLLIANGLFWLGFGIEFVTHSTAYVPHVPLFEETAPLYCYFGRGLPIEQWMAPFMRVARLVQWPSFFLARPFFWYFNAHDIVGERIYWGISVTGYYLLLVCVFSFLQWYFIARFIDFMRNISSPD